MTARASARKGDDEVTELKEQEHRGEVKPLAAPVVQASVSPVLGAGRAPTRPEL
jgi:hypothetical protein